MLGILPTELILLVLGYCDTPTYLQVAFSCRTLFAIASGSRDLVSHHVLQTPGWEEWDDGHENHSSSELFRVLLGWSCQELYGAEFHADRKLFDFQGKVIDIQASSLELVKNPLASSLANAVTHLQTLLAFQNHSTVYLCDLRDGTLSYKRQFESPAKQLGETKILHTAVGGRGVYVLHRFQPFIDQDLDTNHPFVKQALGSNSNGSIFLAWHNLDADQVRLYAFPDQEEYVPVAFAAHDMTFAISWQHERHSDDHQVILYTRHDYLGGDIDYMKHGPNGSQVTPVISSSYRLCVLTEVSDHRTTHGILREKGPTMKLTFNDRGNQLLHHYRAKTLYGSFQRIQQIQGISSSADPPPDMTTNYAHVNFSDSLVLSFAIGIPFFGTHDTDIGNTCHWQYLSVGIATHRVEKWKVACLLKSESWPRSHNCGGDGHRWNIERGRRFDEWEVVAQLGGFHEQSTSHGSVIAASPLGTRVAIASWKAISIWALQPDVLINEENGYYPESWHTPDGFFVLPPTNIQLDAVCFELRFTEKEDELVAITDRGLQFLNIRPDGRNLRVQEKVNTEEWV